MEPFEAFTGLGGGSGGGVEPRRQCLWVSLDPGRWWVGFVSKENWSGGDWMSEVNDQAE